MASIPHQESYALLPTPMEKAHNLCGSPLSFGTSTFRRRYAIAFDEGSGYLLVDYLADGSSSLTMLVVSLEDGQLYVRKLHDTQPFNDKLTVQCTDVANAVSQSHVPKLVATAYYNRTIVQPFHHHNGEVKYKDLQLATPATTWQFCNGGTLWQVYQAWDNFHQIAMPEPFIWNFFASLLETFIQVHSQGVVHQDVHPGNFLLHWPPCTPLPELYLADFGLGKRYPIVNDPLFSMPFCGVFDENGFPSSTTLSGEEKNNIDLWYHSAIEDMKLGVLMLSTLVTTRQNRGYIRTELAKPPRFATKFFNSHVTAGNGYEQYSAKLLEMLATWANMLDTLANNPPLLMSNLEQLLILTRQTAEPIIQDFKAVPFKYPGAKTWIRHPTHYPRPMVWKDPTPLFRKTHGPAPAFDDDEDGHLISQGEDGAFNLFPHWRNGDNWFSSPRIEIRNTPKCVENGFALRNDTFRIAELQYDVNNFSWRFIRFVDSLDLVPDLSPDDDTQFDWNNFGYSQQTQSFFHDTGSSSSDEVRTPPVLATDDVANTDDLQTPYAEHTASSVRKWVHVNNPLPQPAPVVMKPHAAVIVNVGDEMEFGADNVDANANASAGDVMTGRRYGMLFRSCKGSACRPRTSI